MRISRLMEVDMTDNERLALRNKVSELRLVVLELRNEMYKHAASETNTPLLPAITFVQSAENMLAGAAKTMCVS